MTSLSTQTTPTVLRVLLSVSRETRVRDDHNVHIHRHAEWPTRYLGKSCDVIRPDWVMYVFSPVPSLLFTMSHSAKHSHPYGASHKAVLRCQTQCLMFAHCLRHTEVDATVDVAA
jgi:hypothetical protein